MRHHHILQNPYMKVIETTEQAMADIQEEYAKLGVLTVTQVEIRDEAIASLLRVRDSLHDSYKKLMDEKQQ